MADRPIIFSAPMVRALLDGRKTQTRRVLKSRVSKYGRTLWPCYQIGRRISDMCHPPRIFSPDVGEKGAFSPTPISGGDRLYVREAFSYESLDVDRNGFMPPWYWADGNPTSGDFTKPKPSIHMPRWASRITLIVTDVRVQRLQEISPEDAREEGVERCSKSVRQMWLFGADKAGREAIYLRACVWEYQQLWDSLNVKRGFGWDTNPWVVAVTFRVIKQNIDQIAEVE